MGLYGEGTMKVVGLKETSVRLEDVITKLKAYGWIQCYLLPQLETIYDNDRLIYGLDLMYSDLIDELEAIVDTPKKTEDDDYASFKKRLDKERKLSVVKSAVKDLEEQEA